MKRKTIEKLLGDRAAELLDGVGELELPASWTFPMPPSVNGAYTTGTDRRTGRKRRFLSDKGREYKRAVANIVKGKLPHGFYTLHLHFHYPWYYKNGNVNRFDETNRIKVLEDVVAAAVGVDDNHFKRPRIASTDTTETGRDQFVVVTLTRLQDNPST